MSVTIAIDVMGGDVGPAVTVPAALELLKRHADARVVLVGEEIAVARALKAEPDAPSFGDRIRQVAARESVSMEDAPAQAMRRKRDSSMHVALTQVREGLADAAISAGNTGAWMAIASLILRTSPGIDRPALCSMLPNQKGASTLMLDLGANVDCKAENLYQFALMGSALAVGMTGRAKPVVGLLNIGEEEMKGNEVVKQSATLLKDAHARGVIEFCGNVEGSDIFKGTADVVVCDGFVGNVALKTSEGLAQMIGRELKTEFERTWLTKLGALFALPVLKAFRNRFDHRRHNGAFLLGLNGIVIKSHGSADRLAFVSALERAYSAVASGVLEGIAQRIAAEPQPAAASATTRTDAQATEHAVEKAA